MTIYHIVAFFVALALLQGCASNQNHLVLDPVGPPPGRVANEGSTGRLIVYSAFDVHAHFNDGSYKRSYSDYKIFSQDRRYLQPVHNDANGFSKGPKVIELSQGHYRVVARANGYGWVTIPVLVEAGKVTTVHLEGGRTWGPMDQLSTNAVRLPDGRIAGWSGK